MYNSGPPLIFRKRYVPLETIALKDDQILHCENKMIITKWKALKPRPDISTGVSSYFINKGFKVSKVFDYEGQLVYWYCDIIRTIRNLPENRITFEDLLLDVIILNDGTVKIMDLGELATAFQNNMIPKDIMIEALNKMNGLLEIIYNGEFSKYQDIVDSYT